MLLNTVQSRNGFCRFIAGNVSLIRDNAENRAAVRVQSLCRKYLCRVGARICGV
jgi:hypothetical protein